MKKIMFNDYYALTEAVLDGRKTTTRRIVSEKLWDKWTEYDDFCGSVGVAGLAEIGVDVTREYSNCEKFFIDNSPFKIGEVAAIAQSYKDVGFNPEAPLMEANGVGRYIRTEFSPGWSNKMFVRADLMPHQIRITDIRVERLQDIGDVDCLAEGIELSHKAQRFYVSNDNGVRIWLGETPREAFASLIDRVSGKGTWESNPYVFAYDFKLVK